MVHRRLVHLLLVAPLLAACASAGGDAEETSGSDGGAAAEGGGSTTGGDGGTTSSSGTGGSDASGGGAPGGGDVVGGGGPGGGPGDGGGGAGEPLCADSLTSGDASTGGWDGMMFDLLVAQELTVTGFDVPLIAGTHDLAIHVVETGFYINQTNALPWVQVASVTGVSSSGPSTPTAITLDTPVTMAGGSQWGIYITTVGTDGFGVEYTAGVSIGTSAASDGRLQILDGVGTNYPFQGAIGNEVPRRFTGSVHYDAVCD